MWIESETKGIYQKAQVVIHKSLKSLKSLKSKVPLKLDSKT